MTKYPILLVHGIGFRDSKKVGYWGRIPDVLKTHGNAVFHSDQDGWGIIENSIPALSKNLDMALRESGADKVNIIAHSRGGLDSRYLVTDPNTAKKIASITTISTPHKGSKSMDFIMKFPKPLIKFVGIFVNLTSKILGDENPNFYESCMQVTTKKMIEFNDKIKIPENIYFQSYGASMTKHSSDIIMMIQHMIISVFEGENDGIVATDSASWGNFQGILVGTGKRGVSHADVVDLRRRPFPTDDVDMNRNISYPYIAVNDITDIYLKIAADLAEHGC